MCKDILLAEKWFDFYRSRGMNPLPSRMDAKRPLVSYKTYYEEPVPDDLFDAHPTTNLQLVCGRRWQLLVIDLDSEEAARWFRDRGEIREPTWVSRSGGAGSHVWFRVPCDYPRELKPACLWKGEGKHNRIDRLCDGSVVRVPPSIHPETKARSVFESKAHSPVMLPFPAWCPDWVLKLQPIDRDAEKRRMRTPIFIEAIPGKIDLARSWGVRLASNGPDRGGFWKCHAIDREDFHPSACISERSGYYVDFALGTKLSFVALGVALRAYPDIQSALTDLRRRSA